METEFGTVIRVSKKIATVQISREIKCTTGCKHCIMARDGKSMITKAYDKIGVNAGDKVVVISREIHQVKDGFILFLLPLILFFIGYTIGSNSPAGFIRVLAGMLFGFLPFIYIRLNKKRYQMYIDKII